MVFSGTRFSAKRKICTPDHSSSAMDFAWLNAYRWPSFCTGNSKTSICGATAGCRSDSEFFHPQLTILAIDLLATFLAFASCHSRHSATVLNGAVTCGGPVCGYVPERRLSQYFSWSVTPEAWRDRTVRKRDSVNLSENVSGRTLFGANKPWYSLAMLVESPAQG